MLPSDFESVAWVEHREKLFATIEHIGVWLVRRRPVCGPAPDRPARLTAGWKTPFAAYVASRFTNRIAMQVLVVAIGWDVYSIARETMSAQAAALRLGLIGLAQFLPLFLLSLPAGWLADHHNRAAIGRWSGLAELICAAGLTASVVIGKGELPIVFVAAAALGAAQAFSGPALSAYISAIVPAAKLPRAIALASIFGQIAVVGGPALGGVLRGASQTAPYVTTCLLLLISVIGLWLATPDDRRRSPRDTKDQGSIKAGLRYILNNQVLLGAISLDLAAVLLGGATALLPVYARDVFHIGAFGLGLLRAAPALGAAVVAGFLSVRPVRAGAGSKLLLAVAIFGAATIGFGLSSTLLPALAFLFVLGGADMTSMYVRQSLMQIATPDAMRGRVASIYNIFVSGSNELGEMESGAAAALIGPVATVVAGGVAALVVAIAWIGLFPQLRRLSTLS